MILSQTGRGVSAGGKNPPEYPPPPFLSQPVRPTKALRKSRPNILKRLWREYTIKILMTEDIPPGGLERSSFLFVPEGEGAKAGRIIRKRCLYKKFRLLNPACALGAAHLKVPSGVFLPALNK